MQAQIVQLPTELAKLREADRLVQRWFEVQALEGAEKVSAVFEWRLEMIDHQGRFFEDRIK